MVTEIVCYEICEGKCQIRKTSILQINPIVFSSHFSTHLKCLGNKYHTFTSHVHFKKISEANAFKR